MNAEKYIKLSDLYSIINKYKIPRDVRAQKKIEAAAIDLKNLQISCSEFPNNWVPCSERLPEEFKNVLLCTDADVIFVGWSYIWNDDYSFDDDNGMALENDVVAWMPLPAPYQAKEDES